MGRPADLFAIAAFALLGFLLLASPMFSSGQNLGVSIRGTGFAFRPEVGFLAMAGILTWWAFAYALWPLRLNVYAGLWHFWLTTLSVLFFWTSFYLMGFLGFPREHPQLAIWTMAVFTVAGLVFALIQCVFFVNLCFAATRLLRSRWT
ncbi:MAG TPA: hypothetical protein VJQ82_08945 [Terriglobales bacterium]|nr:hypothetical protein [Terriglobales bacterium]